MNKEELLILAEYAFGEAMCAQERKVEPRDLNQAYEQIVALVKNQPTITEEDIQGWATGARDRVEAGRHWGDVENIMKEMLTEIGVSITVGKEE